MVEIKGSVVGDSVKTIKTQYGEEAYQSVLGLLKPETRTMLDIGNAMPMDWYPLDAFIELLEADLKTTANGDEQELIRRSEELMGRQLTGIYNAFVKLGSTEFILSRMSTINQTYFRGVTVETNLSEPGKAVIKLTGFTKEHRLIGLSVIGFYKRALEASGAKNITAGFAVPIEEGKGYCELVLAWTDD